MTIKMVLNGVDIDTSSFSLDETDSSNCYIISGGISDIRISRDIIDRSELWIDGQQARQVVCSDFQKKYTHNYVTFTAKVLL